MLAIPFGGRVADPLFYETGYSVIQPFEAGFVSGKKRAMTQVMKDDEQAKFKEGERQNKKGAVVSLLVHAIKNHTFPAKRTEQIKTGFCIICRRTFFFYISANVFDAFFGECVFHHFDKKNRFK